MGITSRDLAGSQLRYRIMAIWAGVMSLLLWFVDLPVKYLMNDSSLHDKVIWIPILHGFTYPIYVVAAFHLGLASRWSLAKIIGFILAGTLPIASLVAERKVFAEQVH